MRVGADTRKTRRPTHARVQTRQPFGVPVVRAESRASSSARPSTDVLAAVPMEVAV